MVTQQHCFALFIIFIGLIRVVSVTNWVTAFARLLIGREIPGCLTHPAMCHFLIGCWDKWVLWWTVTTQSVSWLVVLIGRHQCDRSWQGVALCQCLPIDAKCVSEWVLIVYMLWNCLLGFWDVLILCVSIYVIWIDVNNHVCSSVVTHRYPIPSKLFWTSCCH